MKNNTLNIRYRITPETHSRKIREVQVFAPKTEVLLKYAREAEDRAAKRHIAFIEKGPGAIWPFLHVDPLFPRFKNKGIRHSYDQHKPTESFRCTSLTGAQKAINKRNKEAVISAVFTDKSGNQTILI